MRHWLGFLLICCWIAMSVTTIGLVQAPKIPHVISPLQASVLGISMHLLPIFGYCAGLLLIMFVVRGFYRMVKRLFTERTVRIVHSAQ